MEVLTYPMEESGGKPLYKYIYECIRKDILSGKLAGGERLPSKRVLASNLGVSVITVENAYFLLETEGFAHAVEKKGYYVSSNVMREIYSGDQSRDKDKEKEKEASLDGEMKETGKDGFAEETIDFTTNHIESDSFPFDSWARLSRRILLDKEVSFLKAPEGCGVYELREAISDYLYQAKGINAPAARIIIGPGTEYLHHILIQLLGRNSFTAVEDPGYKKVGKIYESNGVKVLPIPVGEDGMMIERLPESGAKLIHLSPSHHFPTGCVMPTEKRKQLLSWAVRQEAYIIEDDYDSEFRFSGHPLPTLYSMNSERVIYMNTFTRSLAPSIRVAYMVLPGELVSAYREKLSFYSATVSAFEQYTLAAFIKEGFYERHIRRMQSRFSKNRENLLSAIEESGLKSYANVIVSPVGLHLIIEVNSGFNKNFRKVLETKHIKIAPLELYCYSNALNYCDKYLLCYGDYEKDVLLKAMRDIKDALCGK